VAIVTTDRRKLTADKLRALALLVENEIADATIDLDPILDKDDLKNRHMIIRAVVPATMRP
jgi:hypothetical protein